MGKNFDWKKLADMPSGTEEYEKLLELTKYEDEHPEWYDHECYCQLYMSYAD